VSVVQVHAPSLATFRTFWLVARRHVRHSMVRFHSRPISTAATSHLRQVDNAPPIWAVPQLIVVRNTRALLASIYVSVEMTLFLVASSGA